MTLPPVNSCVWFNLERERKSSVSYDTTKKCTPNPSTSPLELRVIPMVLSTVDGMYVDTFAIGSLLYEMDRSALRIWTMRRLLNLGCIAYFKIRESTQNSNL